jgi:O-antigen/teichoic acid export membrane protein
VSALQDNRAGATPQPSQTWVWQAFARSVRNNLLGEAGVQAVRVGGMVVLARALAPSDFGLFRVLITVTTIVMIVNDFGVPDALVQRMDLRAEHESTGAWVNLALSLFTAAALYLGAPLMARAMAMPALPPALRLLCIPLMLEGLAAVSTSRLTRRLDFGRLAMAEVVAELAFGAAAIVLLVAGYPRWSLAGGLAARLAGHALTVFSAEPFLPHGRVSRRALGELQGFAGGVLSGRLLFSISNNADYLMVGRLLGSSALGFYGMAWDLLRFVPDRLHKVAGRVTVPAFCRMQERPAEMRAAFLNFVGYLSRVVLPVLVCVALAAPELLRGIYGAKWIGTATPLQILSVGLIGVGTRGAIGAVYYAKGRPSLDVYLHGLRLALIAVAIFSTAPGGLLAVCVAMSAVELGISAIGHLIACRLLGTNLLAVAAAMVPCLKTTAACAAAILAGKALAANLQLDGVTALAAIVMPAAAAFAWLEAGTARELIGSALNALRGVSLAQARGERA